MLNIIRSHARKTFGMRRLRFTYILHKLLFYFCLPLSLSRSLSLWLAHS